jgi:S-formylglutathione hydrolase FrmB
MNLDMNFSGKHGQALFKQVAISFLLILLTCSGALSQAGKIVREPVHGVSLEKTATGESADRNVTVYLPPGYAAAPDKRYPVVYLLHGIADSDKTWMQDPGEWSNIKSVMDKGIAENKFGEMIIVIPDEKTKWFGSFYVNSSATGNWEDFTVKELVSFIDGKYRTLARVASRGIAGHSMGGYGAITLGMKHPDIYSVVYGMNPALMGWGGDLTIENPAFTSVLKAKTQDELLPGGIYSIGMLTVAQAFSPNPAKPPFFADFPYALVGGKLQPAEPAYSKWLENFPVNMAGKYKDNLKKLKGLRFDSGYDDEFRFIPVNCRAFSLVLTTHGIDHVFEEYNGDHRNRMWGRSGRLATEVMPYFWMLLEHGNRN